MRHWMGIAFFLGVVAVVPCLARTHEQTRARVPSFSSAWNLVPGSGARYEVVDQSGRKFTLELSIVGKEVVGTKDAYWMELSSQPEPPNIGTVAKILFHRDGKEIVFTGRLIQQVPGNGAVEVLPFNYVSDYLRIVVGYRSDVHEWAFSTLDQYGISTSTEAGGDSPNDKIPRLDDIGKEDVTTPAGTFSCEHFRYKHGGGDVWIAAEAAPFGLVKVETKNQTRMLLTDLLNDMKDKIRGVPRPLAPRESMWDKGPPKGIVRSYDWMFSLLWFEVDVRSQKR